MPVGLAPIDVVSSSPHKRHQGLSSPSRRKSATRQNKRMRFRACPSPPEDGGAVVDVRSPSPKKAKLEGRKKRQSVALGRGLEESASSIASPSVPVSKHPRLATTPSPKKLFSGRSVPAKKLTGSSNCRRREIERKQLKETFCELYKVPWVRDNFEVESYDGEGEANLYICE